MFMASSIKLTLTILMSIFIMTCTNKWTAYPDHFESYKNCDPLSFDELQMVFVPGYENTAVVVEDCEYFRKEKVSIALRVFEDEWQKAFYRSAMVSKNLRELIITFSFERKYATGYSIFGELIHNGGLKGATMAKNVVWVYTKPYYRICDSSLAHELVHASIWAINGIHGDPDHNGLEFKGWSEEHNVLIQRVNSHLCELGI